MLQPFVSSITGCARCDGDGHADVAWRPLAHPVVDSDGTEWTHWALCPTNGEPILMLNRPHQQQSPIERYRHFIESVARSPLVPTGWSARAREVLAGPAGPPPEDDLPFDGGVSQA